MSARNKNELLEEFQVELDAADQELRPDYNVAPTKPVYAVLSRTPKDAATDRPIRQLRVLRWGLVPSWAKDPSVGSKMINARVETVAEKPAYRRAFAERRCLLPADGYFEWAVLDEKDAKGRPKKQPYFVRPEDGGVLAMAGLYEFWRDRGRPEDDPLAWLVTCTVITTSAVDAAGTVHDRMPMLIERDRWGEWLDPGVPDARGFLIPAGSTGLRVHPVSTAVNSVRNNGPELIEPLKDAEGDGQALL
ncbi:putative SOS response-associated peptidase YedK [Streptosporangium becharense]|uniref:Abasic site processing protein n=1 Tax=Streptosporangium becharense TaxID=1816182 RepID=A0A7W9IIN9_9ACTN|nr:putative SOS response-associated peptidase YedK [Streptosporangium becharense]MBB5821281.1 putative SOS response-associated peptidase YedK [Streptosporangium becharense]